jgi:hypothetical protein
MIILHYGRGKDLSQDILKIEFKNTKHLKMFLQGVMQESESKETVYLLTSNHSVDLEDKCNEFSKEIIIESDFTLIYLFVDRCLDYCDTTIYLQEYGSFEDAYKVALDMRESNELCYSK